MKTFEKFLLRNNTIVTPSYGVIVIKNGIVQNYNEPHGSMYRSVGWTDNVKPYCKDCIMDFDKGDPHPFQIQRGKCNQCKYNDNVRGVPINEVTKDCRGNSLNWHTSYEFISYAFIGDETLTVAFTHQGPDFFVKRNHYEDDELERDVTKFCAWWDDRKVYRNWINVDYRRVEFNIRKIGNPRSNVNVFTMYWNGDFYRVIFGYGIPVYNMDWYTHLNKYYRKGVAKKISNYINRWVKDDGVKILVDDEMQVAFYSSVWGIRNYGTKIGYDFSPIGEEDLDGIKKFIEDNYELNHGCLDGCTCIADIADTLNFYYRFRKFKTPFHNEFWTDERYNNFNIKFVEEGDKVIDGKEVS